MERTNVYKPEFNTCPICGSHLIYRYTVSNKVIQFSNGNKIRVKNLGYSCQNLECIGSNIIYTSQTASKMCVKGYTYSSKVLAMIYLMKEDKKSRDEICDRLALKGIEISDRNIDIIHNKYQEMLNIDYLTNIKVEYLYMKNHYNKIMLAIDSIKIDDKRILSIRNPFNNHQIGLHILKYNEVEETKKLLSKYVDDPLITSIITVRRQTAFFSLLDSVVNRKMKYYYFIKY